MSRFIPQHENASDILQAAAAWRDRCWLGDGSVFSSNPLWTNAALTELDERFNGRPDNSNNSFMDKLRWQLENATPEVSQLAAEMLWIMNLFPSNIGPDRKRKTVLEVWSWSGTVLSPEHPMLDRNLLQGMGSAGPGFLAHRPRELRFLINASRALKEFPRDEREALFFDGWTFAQWLDDVPDEGYRQLKHILPFLLFPDDFERIASPGDVRRILEKLGPTDRQQLARASKIELDKMILTLRRRLEQETGAPIDFYEARHKEIWKPVTETPEAPVSTSRDTAGEVSSAKAAPLNQILYGPPGTGKTYHTVDRALAILDPGFARDNQGDREALKSRFDELVEENRVRFVTFHQSFSYEDFVEGLRAEARPDGSIHYYVADGVLKEFCGADGTGRRFKAGTRLGNGYEVVRSTSEVLWLRKPNGSNLPMPWEILNALRDHVDRGDVSIEDVRLGKVFERLPDSLLEKYIVNGYNNILPHILEAMRARGEEPITPVAKRVLIIDEINRGNVSKIFGELITLIEPSKRAGADEALTVTLPYSKQPFSVPAALHIIGTMNTADRSLASIDLALRRRFVFEEVEPDPATLEGVEIAGVDIEALLETMNARIESLLDRDHRLGHAYFLGLEASDDIGPLRDLFVVQILPLLQEYFFDDWTRIRLILNDHRKSDPDDRFVVEADKAGEALFGSGDLEVPITKSWRINPAAFQRASAYKLIIG